MITATVRYKLPPSIDCAACRAHFHKIAPGFQPVVDQQHSIWSESGWGRRRLPVADAGGRPALLQRPLAQRHRRTLRHAAGDRILRGVRAHRQRARHRRSRSRSGPRSPLSHTPYNRARSLTIARRRRERNSYGCFYDHWL